MAADLRGDEHHLLERYRRRLDVDRALAKIILETHGPVQLPAAVPVSKLPGDPTAMRGVPVLAPGVHSAIRGTSPHVAVLNLDRRY